MTAWRRVVNSGAGVGAGAGGKLARVQVETPADTTNLQQAHINQLEPSQVSR